MSVRVVFPRKVQDVSEGLTPSTALIGILMLGLVVRMLFVGAEGYRGDVASFESWALTAASNPLSDFYAKAGFADYPPGYLLVLWLVGGIHNLFFAAHPNYGVLHTLVKLPAILFDIFDAALIFAIVRRYAAPTWAVIAAAAYALNPATIYVSAYWGQVDSVPAGFLLAAVALMVYAPVQTAQRERIFTVLAWMSLGYAVLIKPPAIMLGLLLVAFAFATPNWADRARRLVNVGLGVVAAFALAILVAFVFHPHADVLTWLIDRYRFGSNVYPFSSVNAFNLHSVFRPFWQSDAEAIMLGPLNVGTLSLWGIILVVGASALVVARYLQRRTDKAFIEAAMLLSLGFFILATRMHERYVFNALVLMVPLIAIGRRYIFATVVLSFTLLVNLAYSLEYMHVMEAKIGGVNGADLWPAITHPLSLLNVAVFFVLGYIYLGGTVRGLADAPKGDANAREAVAIAKPELQWSALLAGRSWFSPLQGLVKMERRDWLIAGGLFAVAFVLDYAWYWLPGEKIFDEIYYPRSGAEYLGGHRINTDWEFPFEWTHPPLTKLLIALSMLMFGGLAHGDTAWGWRFVNVVVGSLIVPLVYVFAKRLTASTMFAIVAAFLSTFDGFRFVQARIATPEIFVAFFTLFVLYAFYRFWTAAQIRVRAIVPGAFGLRFWGIFAGGTVLAVAFSALVNKLGASPPNANSYGVAFVYAEVGAYLAARILARRFGAPSGTVASYADGTRVIPAATGDARIIALDGSSSAVATYDELVVTMRPEGTLEYATPEGTATFAPIGTMRTSLGTVDARAATTWLGVLCIAMAVLASSKWNGLFDFVVVVGAIGVVAVQRFIPRRSILGNPFGFTPDIILAALLFVGATLYALCYIPNFRLGYNLSDIVGMQQQMYWYHSNLTKNNPASLNHPYGSFWWQWPTLLAPISYFWHDSRTGAAANDGAACCVAEIIALPNPLVWWFGLASVPLMAYWGWRERNKGYLLLTAAYMFHWLPWIITPRISFLYHFFPNAAIIVLANTVVLQRTWAKMNDRWIVWAYLAAVLLAFAFFYPIYSGMQLTYNSWNTRMWLDNWLNYFHWHPHGWSWIKPN